MKLAIFGGTGKTGQHLIQQALDKGHEVVALVRTPSKVTTHHPQLKIIQGDIVDADCIAGVVQGVDAVISVLGPTNNKLEYTISRGMENILMAMKKQNVHRIVISAGAGVREPQDRPNLIDRFFGLLLNVLSKNVVADMKQVVHKVQTSDRDWTVVRVPMLTDQPAQGTLVVGNVGDIRSRISRADMAAFMLKQLNDNRYLKLSPAISN
ncbi:MAG: SDR family oxidoreductase [Anaerolineae bacterium]|nr:SDR family oxidoreductase [Anaerolineae bacterium]